MRCSVLKGLQCGMFWPRTCWPDFSYNGEGAFGQHSIISYIYRTIISDILHIFISNTICHYSTPVSLHIRSFFSFPTCLLSPHVILEMTTYYIHVYGYFYLAPDDVTFFYCIKWIGQNVPLAKIPGQNVRG